MDFTRKWTSFALEAECDCFGMDRISDAHNKEVEDLKSLCSDLLKGMDKCSEAPYYIVQPFLSIIKKHKDTIKKYNVD